MGEKKKVAGPLSKDEKNGLRQNPLSKKEGKDKKGQIRKILPSRPAPSKLGEEWRDR